MWHPGSQRRGDHRRHECDRPRRIGGVPHGPRCELWAAEQMAALQAMLDAGGVLTGLGAQFIRPIVNAETFWSFSPR